MKRQSVSGGERGEGGGEDREREREGRREGRRGRKRKSEGDVRGRDKKGRRKEEGRWRRVRGRERKGDLYIESERGSIVVNVQVTGKVHFKEKSPTTLSGISTTLHGWHSIH